MPSRTSSNRHRHCFHNPNVTEIDSIRRTMVTCLLLILCFPLDVILCFHIHPPSTILTKMHVVNNQRKFTSTTRTGKTLMKRVSSIEGRSLMQTRREMSASNSDSQPNKPQPPPPPSSSSQQGSSIQSKSLQKRNIKIPLLNLSKTTKEDNEKMIIPLPSEHLPDELSTMHLYGTEFTAPVHQMLIERVTGTNASFSDVSSILGNRIYSNERENNGIGACYGHIVSTPNGDDNLVGAIGCTARVIFSTPSSGEDEIQSMGGDAGEGSSKTVLAKGEFRFIVKEIIQTFPYHIGIVDELLDDPIEVSTNVQDNLGDNDNSDNNDKEEDDDDEDDDDYDDIYESINPTDLIPRSLQATKAYIDQKVNKKQKDRTLLEQSILENSGMQPDFLSTLDSIQKDQNEEMAATFDVFVSSLIDIAPHPMDRYYAVGMMIAQLTQLDNDIRQSILTTTDGTQRLRRVLKEVERKVSMAQVKKLTEEIVEKNDESSKDLKIGDPILPPWAKSIRKGVNVEYWWDEEYEWCKGVVINDPVLIVDELVITVEFDDGEIHRLPFRADEKARWRPAKN